MQSNRFLVHVLVFVVLIWHVSAYYEKRTFRERSKISCRLQKTCKTFDGQDDQYRMMMPLANLLDSQPKNYLLRFPFYILAESNAYIAFSETENPDWLVDDVYEFAFGTWENKRTVISRKREDEGLKYELINDVVSKNSSLKALIEITTAGDIRVYIEHSLKPLLEYKDPNPLRVAYFGFASFSKSLARFYYDCPGEEVYTPQQLAQDCQQTTTSDAEHKNFVAISAKALEDPELLLNLPLMVKGQKEARILVSSDNGPLGQIRSGYEFVLGSDGNRRVGIYSIHDGKMVPLVDNVRRGDIFLNGGTLYTYIKISRHGKVELFTKHDHTQYRLLVDAKDPNYSKAPLNYISFATNNQTQNDFFYNCKTVSSFIDTQLATKYTTFGHPILLEDPVFNKPSEKRKWLTARCKNYTATKFEFNDFFPLKNIAGSQPPGYHARFTFYAQASRNAHVMLTTSLKPKFPEEAVYEFVIGGWVNSRILIRRKKKAQILTQVFNKPILSPKSPTKMVVEVTTDGFIQLFAESLDLFEPIIKVYDPNVLHVNHVSFGAFDNLVKFHYDCQ